MLYDKQIIYVFGNFVPSPNPLPLTVFEQTSYPSIQQRLMQIGRRGSPLACRRVEPDKVTGTPKWPKKRSFNYSTRKIS